MPRHAKKGWTLRTPKQEAAHNQKIIDDFNRRFPAGTDIWYWRTLPFGPVLQTAIRHGAWFLSSGEPVCLVVGVLGCVSIWHIEPIDESRREDINFVK